MTDIGLSIPTRYTELCAEYQLQKMENEWDCYEVNVGPVRVAYALRTGTGWSRTVEFEEDTACLTFQFKSAEAPRRRFMAFWLRAWLFVAALFSPQHGLLLCWLVAAVLSR